MASGSTRYDEDVQRHGLSATHMQTMAWVPEGAKVLELGCSSGFIGSLLIRDKGCEVTGVEIDPAAAAEARRRGLKVFEGSLDDPAFRALITEHYDVVIAADVLEHLADPAPALQACKEWLKPGGHAIIAVPNVATWSMRAQLFFRGDFEYQETGLLDRTHLRFFTYDTLHTFVREQGWHIEEVMVDSWELPLGQTLFFEWPHQVRRKLTPDGGERPDNFLWREVHKRAGNVMSVHQAVASRLGRRFPNLCATHIALLLTVPTTG